MSAEGIVLLGGGAAILLQIAHPSVAAGVARHSDFERNSLRRLEGTLDFVTAVVHGTHHDRSLVRARVNGAHSRVRGETYDATDPEAQRWVAATLYFAARQAHARTFGPSDEDSSQSLLDCFEMIGTELQVSSRDWPATVEDFNLWWAAEIGTKHVGEDARAVFQQLRRPTGAPPVLRLAIPMVMRISLAMIPKQLRVAFYPEWTKIDRFLVELFWTVAVPIYRMIPRRVRTSLVGRQLRHLRTMPSSVSANARAGEGRRKRDDSYAR